MERVRDLIHKISAQEAAGEGPADLLSTVRQLAAELEALLPRPVFPQSSRVAVLMPAGTHAPVPTQREGALRQPMVETHSPTSSPLPSPKASAGDERVEAQDHFSTPEREEPAPISGPAFEPAPPPAPAEPSEPVPPSEPAKPSEPSEPSQPYYLRPPAFNPIEEVPTLTQQTPPGPGREVFEQHTPGESLNDRLRREEQELGHKLVDTPIRDLRKGIGINDRYLFVSELFRGDEAMYDRSIKTINAFHILPEAEYWINRELKLKLGWPDTTTVRLFDQLVRRRFS
ncbi:hypothetical protein [Flaviaesturariibacter aridisoli]|uniref:Uncharacterized protein n=1 Tax=Flaviaesturariibacter aridisoli TaxID=2545761 RepID=A0A4R4E0L3_9BACT|nr:hypothetical protein [Flaviaesturariibacter aridisoli]TCZ72896.1 hypothetical protein E0486_07475 [Flaviaesturariibacter aridisoli]